MHKELSPAQEQWSGYTLDELRYRRAVTLARIEVQKEKLRLGAADMRAGSGPFSSAGIAGKIMGSLNYLDYIILAFKASRLIGRTISSFRRH